MTLISGFKNILSAISQSWKPRKVTVELVRKHTDAQTHPHLLGFRFNWSEV